MGEMIRGLGGRTSRLRDAWMTFVGLVIALLCFLGGWYVPMYGAGKIERRNIREYEDAARRAWLAGRPDFAEELLAMAELEWDHELFFHDCVRGHQFHRWSGSWPEPPARDHIRSSFTEFATQCEKRQLVA